LVQSVSAVTDELAFSLSAHGSILREKIEARSAFLPQVSEVIEWRDVLIFNGWKL
jgi:hypothetical protein